MRGMRSSSAVGDAHGPTRVVAVCACLHPDKTPLQSKPTSLARAALPRIGAARQERGFPGAAVPAAPWVEGPGSCSAGCFQQ